MSTNPNPDTQEHQSRRPWWNPVDTDNPKDVRRVYNVLGYVSAGLVVCLIFKAPSSDAVLALGCAAAIVSAVAAGQRLEMIGLRRRIEALECTHDKGGEAAKGS